MDHQRLLDAAPADPDASGGVAAEDLGPDVRVPKYFSLKEMLTERIRNLPAGTALPPERELVSEFRASRTTVRQALKDLAAEGRVVRMHGRGTFVAPPKETISLQLLSYTEEWTRLGRTPSSRLVGLDRVSASPEAATALDVASGTPLLRIERIRLTDGAPMAVEVAHLEAERFDGLETLIDEGVSLYALLEQRWGVVPQTAEQTFETAMATPALATALGTDAGTPLILLNRRTVGVDGRPFEYVRAHYRGDRYRFVSNLSRP